MALGMWHLRACLCLRDNSVSPSAYNGGCHPGLLLYLCFCGFNLVQHGIQLDISTLVFYSHCKKKVQIHIIFSNQHSFPTHRCTGDTIYCHSHLCPRSLGPSFQNLFIFFQNTSQIHSFLSSLLLYQPQVLVSGARVTQQPRWASHWWPPVPPGRVIYSQSSGGCLLLLQNLP